MPVTYSIIGWNNYMYFKQWSTLQKDKYKLTLINSYCIYWINSLVLMNNLKVWKIIYAEHISSVYNRKEELVFVGTFFV